MSEPAVLVFEKRPRWAPELRRQFADENVRIRGCRSTGDAAVILRESPLCVVVIDFEAAPADSLQFLGRMMDGLSPAPVVVVGSKQSAELEWSIRELGAAAFLRECYSGSELAQLCRRQFAAKH